VFGGRLEKNEDREINIKLFGAGELLFSEGEPLQADGLLDVDARNIVVKDMKGLSSLLDATN
jgi:hypothetical protein